jgi:hypothetical protein
MQKLEINGNVVYWGGQPHIKIGYEKVDDMMIHIFFTDCGIGFRGGETEINGVIMNNADEMISMLN